ncbi:M50 family metallopeptidase [Serinibacter salmoneus]|uniref:Peptidase M50B-like protein n=1 Tax=Serinibacter salmoneus TaxID=556530 RepID=A0A2A9CW65_9MICO|nr:M50 family metallopeptidase [Serinibacter salmoneus]PFG18643.1 peptidase M50B-like protein [Serinibacter salmoneus]
MTRILLDSLPWSDAPWWQEVVIRTGRTPHIEGWAVDAAGRWSVWAPLLIGVALVLVPATWRVVRILVTLVHELGHAAVGILTGRRFTGFVVRGDMSGHAVTVGKPHGLGLALTTWAGYPAPALVGTGLIWLTLRGWAPAVMLATAVVSVLCLAFVRSWATAGVTLLVAASAGALWWWRSDYRSGAVLLVIAALLLLGAWRHWAAVAPSPRGSDPADLARQTGWPGWFWVGTQLLAIAAATAGAVWWLWNATLA